MEWRPFLPFLMALGMALLLMGIARSRRKEAVSRLDRVLAEAMPAEEDGDQGGGGPRGLLLPLLSAVGRVASRAYPSRGYLELERELTLAGRPFGWGAREFIGLRALSTAGGGMAGFLPAVGLVAADTALLVALVAGAAGFVAPVRWLRGRIARRQREMGRDLPDALDLMSLCLDAGLGLEGAITVTTRRWQGPLSDELNQALSEVRLGWSRVEALRRLARRTEVSELSAFVAAMIQADQLGTGLRSTLKLQAIDARSAYLRAVREAGHKAPIRMIVPMTLFILPAMFIVIIGPVVPEMARSMLSTP